MECGLAAGTPGPPTAEGALPPRQAPVPQPGSAPLPVAPGLTTHSLYQHQEDEQQGQPRRPGQLQESSETYSFPTACASRRGDVTGPSVREGQPAGHRTTRVPRLRPQRARRETRPFPQGHAPVLELWARAQAQTGREAQGGAARESCIPSL